MFNREQVSVERHSGYGTGQYARGIHLCNDIHDKFREPTLRQKSSFGYDQNMNSTDPPCVNPRDTVSRLTTIHLGLLFALIYFVQGLAEPSEGLIAQPVRSLLHDWHKSPSEIAHFMAMVALPWAIKPLYGLIIDFAPLCGSRRRNYLLLTTLATSVSLLWLGCRVPEENATGPLFLLLVIPTLAVAFSDVVVDALMIEKGQPLGMTGRLQSIQWAAMYAATILAGSLGGWMAEHHRSDLGFMFCGVGAAVSFIATCFWIVDTPSHAETDPHASTDGPGNGTVNEGGSTTDSVTLTKVTPVGKRQGDASDSLRVRLKVMRSTLTNRRFLVLAAFLFLWNFNPFSSSIQHLHMTQQLRLTNQQYGHTYSLFSIGSIATCILYGLVCRIIPGRWLVSLAIAAGVLSTLAYLLVDGVQSAFIVSLFVGFVYMLGNLIQLDIAARMCPPALAGTMFALLMSVSNIALILSTSLGGRLYEWLTSLHGPGVAYSILIWIGSATTALCWGLIPWFQVDRKARDFGSDE